ncbi:MAG: hypothetical protein RDV48_31180 [Candidatus Eremiobacteraeota bacterium]|nr:hypothetical protein [Candidatus Eremiobacteraeota bacterium]
MRKILIPGFLALVLLAAALPSISAEKKPRLFRASSGLVYMRVTEVITKDTIPTDSGKDKPATAGNTFAQIVANFANLTDQTLRDYGYHPVTLTIRAKNLFLVGDNGKYYSGVSATKFLKKDMKPLIEDMPLRPGADMVATMVFHMPKKVKIVGVMYKFEGGRTIVIDYSDPNQVQSP